MSSMQTRDSADLLIEARWVLPIAPATALANHAVAALDGRIVALGPAAALRARFTAREHIVRPAHVLLPGLVDAHTSASRIALRARAVSADLAREGAQLALAQMLRAGITSFASAELHPAEMARLAGQLRMRAAVGLPLSERPTPWAESLTSHLAVAERLWDTYRSDPWVSLYFAPDLTHGLSDAALTHIRAVADELDARIVMPVGSAPQGVRDGAEPGAVPALARLNRLGLLRPGFTALPQARFAPAELELIERTGSALAVCPQPSLRAGRGADCLACLLADLPIGLGTGSPPLALTFDLLAEARAAALAASTLAGRRDALTPERALHLATLGGAQAVGLKSAVGSLEPGKAADLIAIEVASLDGPGTSVAETVLYAATRRHVSDVWINGRPQVLDGRLVALDEQELLALAERHAQAGLSEGGPRSPEEAPG
ncbi:MAG TPA: amidohydrolase family protein [Steroidobacteraceae bacterium]|nr:amidohydrolase family protein [Steroidobacteraceae bacterium]